jgi:hypothetical protein
LTQDARFEVPTVIDSLTTQQVLTMRFLDGSPIESLADAPSAQRHATAIALLELAIREVFDWGLVQTDPNFANYLFAPESGRIQLLDFGATRHYAGHTQIALRRLLQACINGSDGDVETAAADVGYLRPADPAGYRDCVVGLLRTATEPARTGGDYDFARSDLAPRMKDIVMRMRLDERFARVPPPEILFLHRKLGGLYLLLSRLHARVPVATLVSPILSDTSGFAGAGELQRAV